MERKSIKVSEKLHRKLKILSAKTGKTINQIIESYLVDNKNMKKQLTIKQK